jgi:hypothetical protein
LLGQSQGFQFEFFAVFLTHVFLTLCVKCKPLFSGVHFFGARSYRYALVWLSQRAAMYVALLGVSSGSLAIVTHYFGQYPNVLSIALTLHGLAALDKGVKNRPKALWESGAWIAAALFSSLFGAVFGIAAFALPLLLNWLQTKNFTKSMLCSLGIYALILLLWSVVGLSPLGWFLHHDLQLQAPIFHSSWVNVVTWKPFHYYLFHGLYGALWFVIPCLGFWVWRWPFLWIFVPVWLILGLFSTGGTTPLPRWLLGDTLFYNLVYDRFAFWNSLLILPAVAIWLDDAVRIRMQRWLKFMFVGLYIAVFIYNGTAVYRDLPELPPTQETAYLLSQGPYRHYRYLTLGLTRATFGKLSLETMASTLDGNFHFARALPELNDSGVANLSTARYYGPSGMWAVRNVLQAAPRYHLRYILVADPFYEPWLQEQGWVPEGTRTDLGTLWQRTDILPLNGSSEPVYPWHLSIIWGLFPLFSLCVALGLWNRSRI